MGEIWEASLKEICPAMKGRRRVMFFDLADPEKRKPDDIRQALKTIAEFEKYFDVILGLNEKEAHEIGEVLGLQAAGKSPDALSALALEINRRVPVNTLVIHPVSYALAAGNGVVSLVAGPVHPQAHDHHRRRRPFQFRLLPRQIAGPGQRAIRPDRRHHQRPLRPHRPKSRHPGPGENAPVLA